MPAPIERRAARAMAVGLIAMVVYVIFRLAGVL